MSDRLCPSCGCSIQGYHPNRKRCPDCAKKRLQEQERINKGIVLAPDAITCPVCQDRFNILGAGHYRKHGYPDAETFKNAFGLSVLTAPSISAQQAAFMLAHSPTKGRRHTADEITLMSVNRQGRGVGKCGKYERTPEIRDKISKGVTQWRDGQNPFTNGWWVPCEKSRKGEVYVRSTYEARLIEVLEQRTDVETIEMEPFVIPYEFEGQTRRYVPDILAVFEGGIYELWEVKSDRFIKDPKNQAKFKALNAFAAQKGWNAAIVTLSGIEQLERSLDYRVY